MELGRDLPLWALVEMYAERHGLPQWVVDEMDPEYLWRWAYYARQMQNQEAKQWRKLFGST